MSDRARFRGWGRRVRPALAFLAVSCLIGGVLPAEVSKGPYAGGMIGAVIVENSTVDDDFGNHFEATFDPGFTVAGLGGYDFGRIRVDGHVRYLYTKADRFERPGGDASVRGDLQLASVLFNGWIEFENASRITPYLGGGIGAAQARISNVRSGGALLYRSDATAAFAYQAGAGLSFAPARRARIDVGYAYHATSDPDFDVATTEFKSGLVTLAFRYLIETDP